jgi:hypothetical protein
MVSSSAAGAQPASPPALASATNQPSACKSADASEVIVCGRSRERYRIDPSVLAATRAANALPPKPPITGDVPDASCAGAMNCAGGSYVPLVGIALTALQAAELAADGDDWRDAFRTHPDQYRAYQNAKAKKGGVSIGVSVGNR